MIDLEHNKQVGIHLLATAMPQNDLNYVKQVVTPETITHRAGFAALYDATGFPIPKEGNFMDWMVNGWSILHAALSNQTVEMKHVVAEGHQVMLQYHMSALHAGNFAGADATHQRVDWDEVGILTFNDDGKITDMWYLVEEMKVATELGYQLTLTDK